MEIYLVYNENDTKECNEQTWDRGHKKVPLKTVAKFETTATGDCPSVFIEKTIYFL